MYNLLCCVTYFALSIERDLTYISLLIIFCIIVYVTNKIESLNPIILNMFLCSQSKQKLVKIYYAEITTKN